jgi:hypothetical protein
MPPDASRSGSLRSNRMRAAGGIGWLDCGRRVPRPVVLVVCHNSGGGGRQDSAAASFRSPARQDYSWAGGATESGEPEAGAGGAAGCRSGRKSSRASGHSRARSRRRGSSRAVQGFARVDACGRHRSLPPCQGRRETGGTSQGRSRSSASGFRSHGPASRGGSSGVARDRAACSRPSHVRSSACRAARNACRDSTASHGA